MPAKEQEIAGTGCILQFFTDINNCIDTVNKYIIGLDEIEEAYPKPTKPNEEKKRLPDNIEEYMKSIRSEVKFSIMRCNTQLLGVQAVLTDFKTTGIEEIYKKISKGTTPNRDDCQQYIQILYKGFITSILPNLLRSIDIYSDIVKQ